MDKTAIVSRIDLKAYFSERLKNLNAGHPEARADCPFPGCEGGQRQTLAINLETGRYHCHRCDKNGDLFTLHQWATETDFKTALAELAAMAGVDSDAGKQTAKNGDRRKAEEPARGKAKRIWDKAEEATDDHPYLKAKGVKNYGLRIQKGGKYDGALIMPLFDSDGNLQTLQFIMPGGEKRLMRGGKKKGHFFAIGDFWKSDDDNGRPTVCLAEGYATGASIHEATGWFVLVCVDNGNLKSVAEIVGQKFNGTDYPESRILVCGDNDDHGKGQDAARKAAKAKNVLGGHAVWPAKTGQDFNDMAQSEGLEAVKQFIKAAVVASEANKDPANAEKDGPSPTKAQLLIDIGKEAEIFCFEGDCYATVKVNGHHETYPLNSKGFKSHLRRCFFEKHNSTCKNEAIKEALDTLEALSEDGKQKPVFCRVGELDGNVYVDLCNDQWEAVEINAEGWKVVKNHGVKFTRSNAMLPLPAPVRPGKPTAAKYKNEGWERLASLINTKEDNDFILLVSGLVGAFSHGRGYIILIFYGEHGVAKSTVTEISRGIVDPNKAPLRSPPKEEWDLMISAKHAHCLSFDNLSGISPWLSDSLCRIATGGGFAKRTHYSNDEENIISVMKPIILNGIEDITGRNDLADRAIVINLDYIPEERRRLKSDVKKEFEQALPKILGAIFDAVSCAIKNDGKVSLPYKPRMADFAMWIQAAEDALPWEAGDFIDAYEGNREEVFKGSVGASIIERAILHFLRYREGGYWEGSATELLQELEESLDETFIDNKKWPKAPNKLTSAINRVAASLRASGVSYTTGNKKDGAGKSRRFISLSIESRKSIVNRQPGTENTSQQLGNTKQKSVDDKKDSIVNYRQPVPSTVNRAWVCPNCKSGDFWEIEGGLKRCRVCHPPVNKGVDRQPVPSTVNP